MREAFSFYFVVEVRDPRSQSQDSEPNLSDSKIPIVFALVHDHTAGKLLNLDQHLSGMPRNTFVQGTRDWARYTLDIFPSGDPKIHVWNNNQKRTDHHSRYWRTSDLSDLEIEFKQGLL